MTYTRYSERNAINKAIEASLQDVPPGADQDVTHPDIARRNIRPINGEPSLSHDAVGYQRKSTLRRTRRVVDDESEVDVHKMERSYSDAYEDDASTEQLSRDERRIDETFFRLNRNQSQNLSKSTRKRIDDDHAERPQHPMNGHTCLKNFDHESGSEEYPDEDYPDKGPANATPDSHTPYPSDLPQDPPEDFAMVEFQVGKDGDATHFVIRKFLLDQHSSVLAAKFLAASQSNTRLIGNENRFRLRNDSPAAFAVMSRWIHSKLLISVPVLVDDYGRVGGDGHHKTLLDLKKLTVKLGMQELAEDVESLIRDRTDLATTNFHEDGIGGGG